MIEDACLRQVELSCGVIDYVDTEGDGPVMVLLHGLVADHTVWRDVIEDLRRDHRCIAPTLPEGAHRRPLRQDFDLTISSVAALIGELLEGLDLRNVILVENDSGRAQMFVARESARVAKLAIVACEAFENFPPGLPGKLAGWLARIPGGVWLAVQSLRIRAVRNSPLFFGLMSKRPIPDDLMERWLWPLTNNSSVRSDFQRYARSVQGDEMLKAADGLRSFKKPVLIVWPTDNRVMPKDHGPRFVSLISNARLVEIEDSGTLVPLDQPKALANALRSFSLEG
jgi:pimeloyl-ACP methyl ester carboxylesterase